MKKSMIKTQVIISLLFLLLLSGKEVFAGTVQQPCKVKYMVGTVKIRKNGKTKWKDARVNSKLRKNDAVRTFVESSVEIELQNGSIITLEENSTMEISNASFNEDNNSRDTKLRMMYGNLQANVKKMTSTRSKFVFETPTATAAIRGTKLGINVGKIGTRVKVFEGKVFVKSKSGGKGVNLLLNQMAMIKKGQKKIEIEVMKKVKGKAKKAGFSILVPSQGDTITGGKIRVVGTVPVSGFIRSVDIRLDKSTSRCRVRNGQFSGDINVPLKEGSYSLECSYRTRNGKVEKITKTIFVKKRLRGFSLVINSPKDNSVYKTTTIPVSGVTDPGAVVKVGEKVVKVSSAGVFNTMFFLPDESGDYEIKVEAVESKTGKVITKIVNIKYEQTRLPLSLVVNTPKEGKLLKGSRVLVSGVTTGKEVNVNGNPARVINGKFDYYLRIGEKINWDLTTIDVVATNEDEEMSKSISVVVDHSSPAINTSKPMISAVLPRGSVTKRAKILMSILDNTPDDEVEFVSIVDGEKDVEMYGGKDRLTYSLQEGKHRYMFIASDMAKNKSNVVVWEGTLMLKKPTLLLRKPMSAYKKVSLPPDVPDGDFLPKIGIEFEVKDLPDDDYQLLKEVKVINGRARYSESITSFSDTYFEFDVSIKRNAVNTINIVVIDKADNVLQKQVVVDTRY